MDHPHKLADRRHRFEVPIKTDPSWGRIDAVDAVLPIAMEQVRFPLMTAPP
ncbi:MAG: hypothetical protein AAF670_12690 [Planctomycetota bacterium]